jgi:hypothetical protein
VLLFFLGANFCNINFSENEEKHEKIMMLRMLKR